MKEKEIKLHETTDANVWAQEFNRELVSHGEQPFDLDTIRAWFANAIMCGWDHAHWKLEKERLAAKGLVEALEAIMREEEGLGDGAVIWTTAKQAIAAYTSTQGQL